LKKKILLISIAIILAAITSAPLAQALPTVRIYGYTDKSYYKPGETVAFKFWIYNEGPEGIFLKNITIEYPWYSKLWGGNQTIKYQTTVGLEKGQNKSETATFTIPTDGRAYSGYIDVTVWYEVSGQVHSAEPDPAIYLSVASVPWFMSYENMDKIVTLFTVLVVLVIVAAVIIAATIFLAMRRPQVSWKAEQKAE
jgi:hypothetical protein